MTTPKEITHLLSILFFPLSPLHFNGHYFTKDLQVTVDLCFHYGMWNDYSHNGCIYVNKGTDKELKYFLFGFCVQQEVLLCLE